MNRVPKAIILSFFAFSGKLAEAFPGYDANDENHLRSLSVSGANCPMNQIGSELQEANEDAVARLETWEALYPAAEYGRKYTVGSANPGEVYCDGTGENKFCNKVRLHSTTAENTALPKTDTTVY